MTNQAFDRETETKAPPLRCDAANVHALSQLVVRHGPNQCIVGRSPLVAKRVADGYVQALTAYPHGSDRNAASFGQFLVPHGSQQGSFRISPSVIRGTGIGNASPVPIMPDGV